MMYGYGDWGWPFFHGFGALFMIAFTVFVLWGAVAAMRTMTRCHHHGGGGGGEDRASAILRERFAKGEITREQFEQMKKDLG